MITATRVLFALECIAWASVGLIIATDAWDMGIDSSAARAVLATLMLTNAAVMGLLGYHVLRGRRLVDYLAIAVVFANLVLSVTDQVGLLDIAALALNATLLTTLAIVVLRGLASRRAAEAERRG